MNYITSKVELGERSARNRWLTFLFVLLIGIAVSGFIATSAKACGSSCTVGSQGGPSGSGGTAGFEWITFGCTNEDGPDGQPNTGNCGFNAAKTPDQDGGTATTYAFNRFMSAATGNTNTGVQTQTSITNYLNGSTGGPNILSECQQSAFIFALMETPGTTSFNSNSYALDPGEYDTALQTSNEITTKSHQSDQLQHQFLLLRRNSVIGQFGKHRQLRQRQRNKHGAHCYLLVHRRSRDHKDSLF